MDAAGLKRMVMSRRSAIKGGGASALLVSQAALFERLGWAPHRAAHTSTTRTATAFSDIQFDMAAFINPAQVIDDGAGAVTVSFPPVYTLFLPVMLNRTPTRDDQATLADALTIIEASYPASPSGLLIFSIPTSSPRCAMRPRHSNSRSSSWAARTMTMAWSGSSPRPAGRTSWSRRAGTGPSRCWSSPEAGSRRPRPALARWPVSAVTNE